MFLAATLDIRCGGRNGSASEMTGIEAWRLARRTGPENPPPNGQELTNTGYPGCAVVPPAIEPIPR